MDEGVKGFTGREASVDRTSGRMRLPIRWFESPGPGCAGTGNWESILRLLGIGTGHGRIVQGKPGFAVLCVVVFAAVEFFPLRLMLGGAIDGFPSRLSRCFWAPGM